MTTQARKRGLTAITRELIWKRLIAYCDEMAVVLTRASYSPMIRDVRDYATGLVDLEGRTIVINSGGPPSHFEELGEIVLDGVELYGRDGFESGDAVMVNHTHVTGQHVNNVQVYTPVFHEGELVAFAACFAHWQDVGGITANRPTAGTTDCYQEGLQVRSVKTHERGEPNEDVIRLIAGNLRQPEVGLGDLRAQVACCRIGENRMRELLDEFSLTTVSEAVESIRAETAELAAEAVAEIPDGTYRASSFLDEDGFDPDDTVPIDVEVRVEGSRMTVDLSGISPQRRGPINSRSNAPANIAFKSIATPDRALTIGDLDPLTVEVPEGSMMRARAGAPMGSWSWPFSTVIDTILRALAPALGEDGISAGNAGTMYGAGFFFGTDAETGKPFVNLSLVPVGWGARPYGDGVTAHGMMLIQIKDTPVEVTNALSPLVVERFALRPDSGGPGRFRGGLGVELVVRCLKDTFTNFEVDRTKCLPWGLDGGREGLPGKHEVVMPDGSTVVPPRRALNFLVPAGGRVLVATGGGGGYGDPFERPMERVLDDVLDGYVSVEAARRDYGVVIQDSGPRPSLDREATAELRAGRKQSATKTKQKG